MSSITIEIAKFMNEELEKDSELSFAELEQIIGRKFLPKLDSSTIGRFLSH